MYFNTNKKYNGIQILLTVWLVIAAFSIAGAQSDFEKISKDTQLMVQAFETKDYAYFVDGTYPTILELFDRETMVDMVTETFTGDEELLIEIVDIPAMKFDISEIYTSEVDSLRSYAFVIHPLKMKMTLLQDVIDESFREMFLSLLPEDFVVEFEGDHVVYVQSRSLMVAIKDELTDQTWKYLTFDETNFLNEIVFPEEIYVKTRDYYNEVFLKQ